MHKMQKNRSNVAGRAWNLLRLLLLWTRKAAVYRRRLMKDLHLLPNFLATLGHSNQRGAIPYGERELSFDKTPIVRIKMHRPSSMRFKMPNIPCINPQVKFDSDYEYERNNESRAISHCNEEDERRSFFISDGEDSIECEIDGGDEGIDLRAEEFIANFYKQLKLQRQISHLQYTEMINRSTG